ncbi:MAG TPA: hypothetical protein VH912_09500 [Streptosporangiaceae bacterium]|jgi:hypothetical protein
MIRHLVRLYPRRWRDRYGSELDDLVTSLLTDRQPRRRIVADLVRGAADARLQTGVLMLRSYRTAGWVGARYGLTVAAVLATVIYLTNIVFATAKDTDGVKVLFGWLGVFAILGLAGLHAARRSSARFAPLVAGAVAGLIVGAAIVAIFAVLDNVYVDIIGRQEQKIAALAAAGGGDMRTFLNQQLVGMVIVLIPALTAIGAGLGHLGGLIRPASTASPTSMAPGQNPLGLPDH